MNSKSHRYSLNTSSKKELCPRCGEKTFKRYIDNTTCTELGESVGRCDRENNCGFHKPPREYFAELSGDNSFFLQKNSPLVVPQIDRNASSRRSDKSTFSTIEKQILVNSLDNRLRNNFTRFLVRLFDKDTLSDLRKKYLFGSTDDEETVFWQVDFKKQIRSGKIMMYNASTGKRVKNIPPNWIHKKLKLNDFVLKQCFYGEFLLSKDPYKVKTVILVESEKTAIICAGAFPEQIWLATGGLNGLNDEKCKVLQGRKVIAFPDLGGFEKWSKKSSELRHIVRIEVSDFLEKLSTDKERIAGLDIGDYVIGQLLLDKPAAIVGISADTSQQLPIVPIATERTQDGLQKSHEKNLPSEPTCLHTYTDAPSVDSSDVSVNNNIKLQSDSYPYKSNSKLSETNIDREFADMEDERKLIASVVEKSSVFADVQFQLKIGASEDMVINFPILIKLITIRSRHNFELIFEKSQDQLEAVRKSIVLDIPGFEKFKRSGFFRLNQEGYSLSFVYKLKEYKDYIISSGAFAFNLVCEDQIDLSAFRLRLQGVANILLINERPKPNGYHFDILVCFFSKNGYKHEWSKVTKSRADIAYCLTTYLKKMFPESRISEEFKVYSNKDVWINSDLKRIKWKEFQLKIGLIN